MAKEILLYSSIYSFTAANFINELEASKEDDITVRLNTPGGEVFAAYGMIAKFREHPGRKNIKVDGWAASGGAFFLCYADEAEALDVSRFLFHRAAYADWFESDKELFTEELKQRLIDINSSLRKAMESKFTAEEWFKITGVSLDDLFSLENRIDVELDSTAAKKLGIISKIIKITPAKKAEIEAMSMQIAAYGVAKGQKGIEEENLKVHKMTIEKFKTEHPEIFASVLAEGVKQERDRVGAYLAFIDVDAKAVSEGIKSGDPLSQTTMAEFSRKAFSAEVIGRVKSDNAETIKIDDETPGDGEMQAFNASWRQHFKK